MSQTYDEWLDWLVDDTFPDKAVFIMNTVMSICELRVKSH